MKQVTSILIGAGLRGGYVYSQYALDHPDEFKVVAVAEPDQERRELFAAKHNIPKELQYESYEELLQQDKMADCAMICTQDIMHYEPVTMAMQKGYHVLCEKPMSPDKEEIIKMGAMAKKYDRILSVCHVLRYSPFFSKIKESGRGKNWKDDVDSAYRGSWILAPCAQFCKGKLEKQRRIQSDDIAEMLS